MLLRAGVGIRGGELVELAQGLLLGLFDIINRVYIIRERDRGLLKVRSYRTKALVLKEVKVKVIKKKEGR